MKFGRACHAMHFFMKAMHRLCRSALRGLPAKDLQDTKPLGEVTSRAAWRETQTRPTQLELPVMSVHETAEVLRSLRNFLKDFERRPHSQPSVALIERAFLKRGAHGIDDVPASVLRHAGRALDAIDLDAYGPGLVLVRRRIAQVLRRCHGDRSKAAFDELPPPLSLRSFADEPREFNDSLTTFMEIDAMVGQH